MFVLWVLFHVANCKPGYDRSGVFNTDHSRIGSDHTTSLLQLCSECIYSSNNVTFKYMSNMNKLTSIINHFIVSKP